MEELKLNIDFLAPVLVALIAGPLGAFITFTFNKDKFKAEEQMSIASGAAQAVEAISQVLDSLKTELDLTKDELTKATTQLVEMRKQNERLLKENKELLRKVEELRCMVEKLSQGNTLDN